MSIAIGVWVIAVLVAASRVVLGVHWPSDVVASLLLAVTGVAAAERFVEARIRSAGAATVRTGCSRRSIAAPWDFRESNDVELDVVDQPVFEAAAELPAIGFVHRWRQYRAETAVALGGDRADEVRAHFEAAGEQLCLHHLFESLTFFAAFCAPGNHKLDLRVGSDRLVGRQRGFAQRKHGDDADRQAHSCEHGPDRRAHVP